ncbi:hypothetical protein AVEN_155322-1 [Araneus ventricosus]|uniref:Uncharacterized protein n=1 Tax=Araneus ventricosus TaxID=182803 RepID=A0A4Y2WZG7_ARAVE|nr:hypothetical protein AVEN_155322-1 [Araneus ventricosus]
MNIVELINLDYFVYARFINVKRYSYPVTVCVASVKEPDNVVIANIDLEDIWMDEVNDILFRWLCVRKQQQVCGYEFLETVRLPCLRAYLQSYETTDAHTGFSSQFGTYGDKQKEFFEKFFNNVTDIQPCLPRPRRYLDCVKHVSLYWTREIESFQNKLSSVFTS